MRLFNIVVVCCLCSNGLYAGPNDAGPNDALQINVLSGDAVVVPAASGRAANIRVRVTDRASKPVDGALVSAILPALGVGGHFRGGSTIATKETDSDGNVEFTGIRLRQLTGDFTTQIKARKGESTGAAQARQKVSSAPFAEPKGLFSRKHMLMMAVAGAGVTAGILVATLDGSGGSTPARGITVTPGSPVTGGPR
jgi:hypothetical protein